MNLNFLIFLQVSSLVCDCPNEDESKKPGAEPEVVVDTGDNTMKEAGSSNFHIRYIHAAL